MEKGYISKAVNMRIWSLLIHLISSVVIVVEKQLVLVYTGHKYKIDICGPKSKKAKLVFI